MMGSKVEVSHKIGCALAAADFPLEFATTDADALERLRMRPFGVVITSPDSAFDEDLALLEEMRAVRPEAKFIILAHHSTPDKVIAALRARVFACFAPPFNPITIVNVALSAASDLEGQHDIQVLSARAGWVSVRVNCRLITAERVLLFVKEFGSQLPEATRREILLALREILFNAMEHGAAFNPEEVIVVTGVRTKRAVVFYVRDPGAGFRRQSLAHAAIANPPDDPTAHILRREAEGMRPGGYGLLVARGAVDELIYNEVGNEVVLIKYVEPSDAVES
jgi:anti-sigma regulatory factor (Ser/Thr protein kinase)/ActR/RegA family two-component response regulator